MTTRKAAYISTIILGCLFISACPSTAAEVLGTNYFGQIISIDPNFWGQLGVTLNGHTCAGTPVVIVASDHPKYKEFLTLLITALALGKEVHFYQIGAQRTVWGSGFCIVTDMSIGPWPYW